MPRQNHKDYKKNFIDQYIIIKNMIFNWERGMPIVDTELIKNRFNTTYGAFVDRCYKYELLELFPVADSRKLKNYEIIAALWNVYLNKANNSPLTEYWIEYAFTNILKHVPQTNGAYIGRIAGIIMKHPDKFPLPELDAFVRDSINNHISEMKKKEALIAKRKTSRLQVPNATIKKFRQHITSEIYPQGMPVLRKKVQGNKVIYELR